MMQILFQVQVLVRSHFRLATLQMANCTKWILKIMMDWILWAYYFFHACLKIWH